jgi:hypothetical protein
MNTRPLQLAFLSLVVLPLTACKTDGGFHKKGERVACARGFYVAPITGHALAWHGVGDVSNEGLSVQNYWFWEDRVAVGLGLSAIRFHPKGDHIAGGEIDARLRYYLGEAQSLGVFADFTGGYQRTQDHMPPENGTKDNYTFGFGPGFEYVLSENKSLLLGVEFHHFSNRQGRDKDRNPSQNGLLMWIGYAITW